MDQYMITAGGNPIEKEKMWTSDQREKTHRKERCHDATSLGTESHHNPLDGRSKWHVQTAGIRGDNPRREHIK